MAEKRRAAAAAGSSCKKATPSQTLLDFGIKKVASTLGSTSAVDKEETQLSDCDDETTSCCSSTDHQAQPGESLECVGVCCTDSSEPNQPRDRDTLSKTERALCLQKRSVNGEWFDRYKRLTLCETRNVLLCYSCVQADHRRHNFLKERRWCICENGFPLWKACPNSVCKARDIPYPSRGFNETPQCGHCQHCWSYEFQE